MSKEALRAEVAALRESVESLRAELAARPVLAAAHHCHCARPAPAGWWWCSGCGTLAWGQHSCAMLITITYGSNVNSMGASTVMPTNTTRAIGAVN